MYEVPATSAFVLLFTNESAYGADSAKRFLASVDLSAGKPLMVPFEGVWDTGVEEVGNRKFAVRTHALEFLSRHVDAQVILLAGGLDPLSLDLAETFPEATVYDVDMANMDVKRQITEAVSGPTIRFVTSNLADVTALTEALKANGWNPAQPTLLIAEGITYYIPKTVFRQTLAALRTSGGALVLEYAIPDEDIRDPERESIYRDFFARFAELLQLPFAMQRYSQLEVTELAAFLDGKVTRTITQPEAERLRTGANASYTHAEAGVIQVAAVRFA